MGQTSLNQPVTYGMDIQIATEHNIGLNVGNGYTKLASEKGTSVLASYYAGIHDTINKYESFDDGAVVEIIETTTHKNLNGTRWLVGETSLEYFPDTYRQVVDSLAGKQMFALPLFLGAIELAGIAENNARYKVLSSIHDCQVFGTDLRQALEGVHKVRINGSEVKTIDVLTKVGEEGVGAVASVKNLPTGSIGLCDLGHGTTIVSVFRNGRLIEGSRKVIQYGVHQLCEAIATHPDTRRSLGREASLHLIRQGLKTGFDYGNTEFNFADIYGSTIRNWVSSCLSPAFKHLQPRLDSLDALFLTGGGALLPHVAELAAKRDMIKIANPQKAEAVGLYLLSQRVFK